MESGKDNRRELGRQGEDAACRFLEGMGHTILERNWRAGHLEIDIISFNEEGIHFVEVKTRRRNIQAPPQDNVNGTKQRRIVKAALKYLNTTKGIPFGNRECFFDIAAVTCVSGRLEIEWFPQAYIPIYL